MMMHRFKGTQNITHVNMAYYISTTLQRHIKRRTNLRKLDYDTKLGFWQSPSDEVLQMQFFHLQKTKMDSIVGANNALLL